MSAVLDRLFLLSEKNRLPHALMLVNSETAQAFSLSVSLVQYHFCSESHSKPCKKCLSCKKVEERIHPDFLVVETEKQELSIDLIRQLQIWIQRGPHESAYKFAVIRDAQLMNQEAQNALLKTLEEPPPHGKLILTTSSPDRFLPTILSRVQLIRLPQAEFVTSEKEEGPEWISELKSLLLKKTAATTEIFPVTEEIGKERKDLTHFFDTFETFLKDKMLDPETNSVEFEKATTLFEESLKAEQDILRHYGNSQLALDNLLLRWFS